MPAKSSRPASRRATPAIRATPAKRTTSESPRGGARRGGVGGRSKGNLVALRAERNETKSGMLATQRAAKKAAATPNPAAARTADPATRREAFPNLNAFGNPITRPKKKR